MGISVVIPLYNKVDTIVRAVDSVLAQQGVEVEIIIVDDGSTDGSERSVKGYGDQVKYIHQDNAGPSVARNKGARLGHYPFLVFLDADDELLPGCLAAHLHFRGIHPDIPLTIASFRNVDGKKVSEEQRVFERAETFLVNDGYGYVSRFDASFIIDIPSGAICVDRNLFESVGGFDELLRCWEITDFMFKLSFKTDRIGLLDAVYVAIYKSQGNSQFSSTQNNATYLAHFANNILSRMNDIPPDRRAPIVNQVVHIMYALWSAGAISQFKVVARGLCPYLMESNGNARLCKLACLPNVLLHLIRTVKGIVFS